MLYTLKCRRQHWASCTIFLPFFWRLLRWSDLMVLLWCCIVQMKNVSAAEWWIAVCTLAAFLRRGEARRCIYRPRRRRPTPITFSFSPFAKIQSAVSHSPTSHDVRSIMSQQSWSESIQVSFSTQSAYKDVWNMLYDTKNVARVKYKHVTIFKLKPWFLQSYFSNLLRTRIFV